MRRSVLALGVAALLAYAGTHWGPPVAWQLKMLRQQRQCLEYAAPPDQVVSAEPLPVVWDTAFSYERPDPPMLRRVLVAALGERCGTDGTDGPVLFLGERRTKAGRARLVILRRTPPADRMSVDIPISFNVTLIDPATLRSAPVATAERLADVVSPAYDDRPGAAPPMLRFFAGQPDPADPSHFVVRHESNGVAGEVHGWLRDTAGGPAVELEAR